MWSDLTAADWRDDLDYLLAAVERDHADSFHSISPAGWRRHSQSLRSRIPRLAGHEVVVELARLLALVGDGHTVLRLPDVPGFKRLPVRLYRMTDGVFVRAIAPEFAHLGGSPVVAIGGTPILEAWDLTRPLVSRDNERGVWAQVPELLAIPEVLHALGMIRSTERATLTVAGSNGELVSVDPIATQEREPDLLDARLRLRMADPLWLRRSDENWFEYLPDSKTLYLAYNTVRDGAPEPLRELFERALSLIESGAVVRLIVDIRRNHGGNMTLNRPLVDGLIRARRVNRWGHLFVIIGRGTFSAAMNLAVDLERGTRALFVGEPTGARPNHFGENVDVVLPRSGLRATVAGLYWQCSLPDDDREWIAPDIPARLSSADYLHQRDPALDAIMAYQPDPEDAPDGDPSARLARTLGRPPS
jgi:hypothetical protein